MTLWRGLGGCGIGHLTSPSTWSTLEAATTLTPHERKALIGTTVKLTLTIREETQRNRILRPKSLQLHIIHSLLLTTIVQLKKTSGLKRHVCGQPNSLWQIGYRCTCMYSTLARKETPLPTHARHIHKSRTPDMYISHLTPPAPTLCSSMTGVAGVLAGCVSYLHLPLLLHEHCWTTYFDRPFVWFLTMLAGIQPLA